MCGDVAAVAVVRGILGQEFFCGSHGLLPLPCGNDGSLSGLNLYQRIVKFETRLLAGSLKHLCLETLADIRF
jgi:hypothetical protein